MERHLPFPSAVSHCLVFYLQALSSLHPECEYIFQLEKEERRCLQYVAEQANKSTEGAFPFFKSTLLISVRPRQLIEIQGWLQLPCEI